MKLAEMKTKYTVTVGNALVYSGPAEKKAVAEFFRFEGLVNNEHSIFYRKNLTLRKNGEPFNSVIFG